MKNFTPKVTAVLVVCSILTLLVVTCKQSTGPDFGDGEFAGIWVQDVGLAVETLTITTKTFEVRDTGLVNGTMKCSIKSYDENTKHIKMSVTSLSGDYAGTIPIGLVLYVTYSINGNELYFDMDISGYPASSIAFGPYIKQ